MAKVKGQPPEHFLHEKQDVTDRCASVNRFAREIWGLMSWFTGLSMEGL
jgi:hypothetical protein